MNTEAPGAQEETKTESASGSVPVVSMVSEVLEREKKSSVSAPARALLTHEYASMPNDTHNPLSWMVGTGKAGGVDEGEDDRGDEHDAVGTSDAVDVGSSGAGDAVEAEVVSETELHKLVSEGGLVPDREDRESEERDVVSPAPSCQLGGM